MPQAMPPINAEDRAYLLQLARDSIRAVVSGNPLSGLSLDTLSENLCTPRACFVTLHKEGQLRGCTGVLVARVPLVQEVRHSATQTALHDPRFEPVTPLELPDIAIEISVLTHPRRVSYSDPGELLTLLRPGIDGVTLSLGGNRATFLPQVWERVPDTREFLSLLCHKMKLPRLTWQVRLLDVEVYEVEEFAEPHFFTAIDTQSSEAGM